MQNKLLTAATIFVALTMIPTLASAEEPAQEPEGVTETTIEYVDQFFDEELGEFIDVDPAATRTQCHSSNAVCATNVATSSVVCTKPAYRTRQCTAAGTPGGHGVSPLRLPGYVSWNGGAYAYGDCSKSTQYRSGYNSWSGVLGSTGSGSQSTISLCTKVKVWAWGFSGCVSVSARTNADATAYARVSSVTVASTSPSRLYHTASNSMCVTAFGS